MNPKRLAWMAALAAMIAVGPAGRAQTSDGPRGHAAAVPTYSEAQLEQLSAPIALYPDDLIAWVLRAATHPLDIVEAHRWMQAEGSALPTAAQLDAAMNDKPWDPSVKALVPIIHVIETMDTDLAWTRRLGDVYRTQEPALMGAIQALRQRAEAAGTLRSTSEQQVVDDGRDVLIDPAYPDLLPVPYYDPNQVYGDWPWADYPPACFTSPFGLPDWGSAIVFETVVIADFDHDRRHHRHRRIDWHDRRIAPIAVPPPSPAAATVGASARTRHSAADDAPAVRLRAWPRARNGPVAPAPATWPAARQGAVMRVPQSIIRAPRPVIREPEPVLRVPRQAVRAPEPMHAPPQPIARAAGPAFRESRSEAPVFAAERRESWHGADSAPPVRRGRR